MLNRDQSTNPTKQSSVQPQFEDLLHKKASAPDQMSWARGRERMQPLKAGADGLRWRTLRVIMQVRGSWNRRLDTNFTNLNKNQTELIKTVQGNLFKQANFL